ncbi:hypothetical protein LSTR_LSTR003930 [Laodelphax striatellus]|uniref:Uncharacterized protein n=1 Tax=Laodelphax striatellus TaxID=195883 RepID=A0A482X9G9_LAOST|nr:hypothetical protein LSTR_LSTR003930 [Laodelphax striatellus]
MLPWMLTKIKALVLSTEDMIHISPKENDSHGFGPKVKPVKFLSSLFKRKKGSNEDRPVVKVEEASYPESVVPSMDRSVNISGVARVPSTLSVRDILLSPCPLSPAPSTPARSRDIDLDMETLRISRHDNPFLKQVLASRESLADSLEESESDDINLMAQEFGGDLEDPLTLPEVHEHMIRSPPPTSWPRSPNFKLFRFPDMDQTSSQESLNRKSPLQMLVSPRHDSRNIGEFPSSMDEPIRGSTSSMSSPRLPPPPRPHQRSNSDCKERAFSLLNPTPLRSLSDVRRLHNRAEDSQSLVAMETPPTNVT